MDAQVNPDALPLPALEPDGQEPSGGRLAAWLVAHLEAHPEAGTALRYAPGDLIDEGTVSEPALHLVASGELAIQATDGQGARCVVRRVGPGGVVGEGALATAARRADQVRALTAVTVIRVPWSQVRAQMADPRCAAAVLDHLGNLLQQNQDRIIELLSAAGQPPGPGGLDYPGVQ